MAEVLNAMSKAGTICQKRTQLHDLYKQMMEFLSHTLEPREFISILPDSGNISFFVPYIKSCVMFHESKEVFNSVLELSK